MDNMDNNNFIDDLTKTCISVRKGLKDFQKETVLKICQNFLGENPQLRQLVADEVGMGKTIVAKGVISELAYNHLTGTNLTTENTINDNTNISNKGLAQDKFRVVYVCTNQTLAAQNVQKLNVFNRKESSKEYTDKDNDILNSRLSMLHFQIAQNDKNNSTQRVQFISITPTTSFNYGSRRGNVHERALIYCLLSQCDIFKKYSYVLFLLLKGNVRFKRWIEVIDQKIEELESLKTCNDYEVKIQESINNSIIDKNTNTKTNIYKEFITLFRTILRDEKKQERDKRKKHIELSELFNQTNAIKQCLQFFTAEHSNKYEEYIKSLNKEYNKEITKVINGLRTIFSTISIEMLTPDLVIMDEFQRYEYLIHPEATENSEDLNLLIKKFIPAKEEDCRCKVLLLSATPYKPYSTNEEIGQANKDQSYTEFMNVIEFLLGSDEAKLNEFKQIWWDFTQNLNELPINFSEKLDKTIASKNIAEEHLYRLISRTERISAINSDGDFLSNEYVNNSIEITENDLRPYVEITKLIDEIKKKNEYKNEYKNSLAHVPIDYIKSCPFILSFMGYSYEFKKTLSDIIKDQVDKENPNVFNLNHGYKGLVRSTKNLWMNKDSIDNYFSLLESNARLSTLAHTFFGDLGKSNNLSSEMTKNEIDPSMLLWVPPSRPYYPPQGVYKNTENFSKMIIFSAWEMVPKMISSLISYEEVRRILDKIKTKENEEIIKNLKYFNDKTTDGSTDNSSSKSKTNQLTPLKGASLELSRKTENNKTRYGGLEIMPLLYPSVYLASLYNPVESFFQIYGQNDYNRLECAEEEFKRLKLKIRKEILGILSILNQKYVYENKSDIENVSTNLAQKSWRYLTPFLFDIYTGKKASEYTIAEYNRGTNNDKLDKDEEDLGYFSVWLKRYIALLKENEIEDVNEDENEDASDSEIKSQTIQDEILHYVYDELKDIVNGKKYLPKLDNDELNELSEFFVDIVLASPAICAYRTNGKWPARATYIARLFLKRFNNDYASIILYNHDKTHNQDNNDKVWSTVRSVIKYCVDGNFQAMFDEFHHILSDDQTNNNDVIFNKMILALSYRNSSSSVELISKDNKNNIHLEEKTMQYHIAAPFATGKKNDEAASNRNESVRATFNSPLWPFVLASTSSGQEGLDFHYYCRKIVHWNLPSNPIDLEQREGRINRYKCLAVRQSVVHNCNDNQKFYEYDKKRIAQIGIWNYLFEVEKERLSISDNDKEFSDIVPYWTIPDQPVKIERHVPMYPFSLDEAKYDHLIKVVSLYRLTLGQPRQEELLNNYFNSLSDEQQKQLKELFINLSPYSKRKTTNSKCKDSD